MLAQPLRPARINIIAASIFHCIFLSSARQNPQFQVNSFLEKEVYGFQVSASEIRC
jgi:hypothetical protein